MFCEMLMYFLIKKSLKVIKNKQRALDTKIVFISRLVLNFLTIKKDNTIEIAKNNTKQNLSTIFDLIHFNLGPIAIAIKNGIKNGIINL